MLRSLPVILLLAACTKTADTSDLSKNHLLLRYSLTEDKSALMVDVLLLEGSAKRCRALTPEMKIEANGQPLSLDVTGGSGLNYARGDLFFACATPTARANIPVPKDNIVEIKLSDGKGAISAQYDLRGPTTLQPKLLSPSEPSALRAGDEVKLQWPTASKSIEQLEISVSGADEVSCQEELKFNPTHSKELLSFTLPEISDKCRASGATVLVGSFYDEETYGQLSTGEAKRCDGVAKCVIGYNITNSFELGVYAK